MRFIFLALLATVQAVSFHMNCPTGYRYLNGVCRQVFDEDYDDRLPVNRPSQTIRDEECECVPYYMCPSEDVMHNVKVSCSHPLVDVCCKKGASTEVECGWGAIGSSANEVEYGEFPWIVAILDVTTNETWSRPEYIGGGSIVHPQYVLTVAHKVVGMNEKMMKCRAGQLTRLAPEPNVTQDRLVAEIIIHHSYDRQYMANDIALIRLKEPFDVSQPSVRPVCVAQGPPNSTECFASGWGRRQYNSSDQDVDKLKNVRLPLVPREVCWRALQSVDDARRRKRGQEPLMRRELHSSLLCAGGLEDQDTCVGDGGSPLVCQLQMNSTHARWAVFGLVAWGVGCGVSGAPGVYVDVAQFQYWIHQFGKTGVPPAIVASLLG